MGKICINVFILNLYHVLCKICQFVPGLKILFVSGAFGRKEVVVMSGHGSLQCYKEGERGGSKNLNWKYISLKVKYWKYISFKDEKLEIYFIEI